MQKINYSKWCDGCNPENCQGCAPAVKKNDSQWVGLSGEEIYDLWQCNVTLFQFQEIARLVEDKLREKNTKA